MTRETDSEIAVAEIVRRSTATSGVPERVEDPIVAEYVAAILVRAAS